MLRRRLDFEPGVAGAEAAKLKKFSVAGGSKSAAARRRQKPIVQVVSVYMLSFESPWV